MQQAKGYRMVMKVT